MIKPVLLFTSPILHKPCKLVDNFNSPELFQLAQDMLETMGGYHGIGLAANQIGVDKNLCILSLENKTRQIVIANLQLICYNKETTEELEGCLSAPNISVKIKRPTWVEFEYCKLNGEKDKMRLEGFDARIFFHEFEHLQGIMITDSIGKL